MISDGLRGKPPGPGILPAKMMRKTATQKNMTNTVVPPSPRSSSHPRSSPVSPSVSRSPAIFNLVECQLSSALQKSGPFLQPHQRDFLQIYAGVPANPRPAAKSPKAHRKSSAQQRPPVPARPPTAARPPPARALEVAAQLAEIYQLSPKTPAAATQRFLFPTESVLVRSAEFEFDRIPKARQTGESAEPSERPAETPSGGFLQSFYKTAKAPALPPLVVPSSSVSPSPSPPSEFSDFFLASPRPAPPAPGPGEFSAPFKVDKPALNKKNNQKHKTERQKTEKTAKAQVAEAFASAASQASPPSEAPPAGLSVVEWLIAKRAAQHSGEILLSSSEHRERLDRHRAKTAKLEENRARLRSSLQARSQRAAWSPWLNLQRTLQLQVSHKLSMDSHTIFPQRPLSAGEAFELSLISREAADRRREENLNENSWDEMGDSTITGQALFPVSEIEAKYNVAYALDEPPKTSRRSVDQLAASLDRSNNDSPNHRSSTASLIHVCSPRFSISSREFEALEFRQSRLLELEEYLPPSLASTRGRGRGRPSASSNLMDREKLARRQFEHADMAFELALAENSVPQ